MNLKDLSPQFLRYETRAETWTVRNADGTNSQVSGPREYYIPCESIMEAQGVQFLCPKCFTTNGGPIGTHAVICWSRSRGVPDSASPGPGRWSLKGTSLNDLTLNADPPNIARSVLLTQPGCGWHGFVTNGQVT